MYLGNSKREKMVNSGKRFELTVASNVRLSYDYPILLNREFFDPRLGRGMECDLLIITPFKIYCVECKNYNGYIAGDLFDIQWRFASTGRKGKVQNPYLLNKRRIRLIRGIFYKNGFKPPRIENIIVVPDNCNIHVEYKNVLTLTDFMNIVRLDSAINKSLYKVDNIANFMFNNSKRRFV